MAGGGLGRWPAVAFVLLAGSLAVVLPMISAATSHTVGGSKGWTIPSSADFYPNWSSSQKFAVGDTLAFNFPTGIHTVVEVPKSSYDACTTSNQVGPTLATGPATVTITSAGQHYYICSVTGHCSANQKLSITVSGSSPTSSPVPGSSPGDASGPAPAPTAGGPSGGSSPGGDSAAPAAATLGIATAAVAGLSLLVALW